MKTLARFAFFLLIAFTAAMAAAWSGVYDIAADVPHWPVTEQWLKVLRTRSVATRASGIQVPDLDDAALIRSAAGNYDAMCAGCHLKPGKADSELRRGLYPPPPSLVEEGISDPAQAFWIVKHGIKMSAMPAWGRSMEDGYVWGLVAFARQLPRLTPEQYHDAVVASGGHHHGGGGDDHHADGAAAGRDHNEDHDDGDDAHDHDQPAHDGPRPSTQARG